MQWFQDKNNLKSDIFLTPIDTTFGKDMSRDVAQAFMTNTEKYVRHLLVIVLTFFVMTFSWHLRYNVWKLWSIFFFVRFVLNDLVCNELWFELNFKVEH